MAHTLPVGCEVAEYRHRVLSSSGVMHTGFLGLKGAVVGAGAVLDRTGEGMTTSALPCMEAVWCGLHHPQREVKHDTRRPGIAGCVRC